MKHLIGQTLDRYQIIALLGQGGMGAVFRARDITLKREVALKVLHAHLAAQPTFKERFLQEAQTAAQLDHTGIIKVYDFGQSNELLYIVMEFIQGANLAQMLETLRTEQRWLLLPEAIELVRQVALALDYAHQRGVLHRDIKPANIMIKRTPSGSLPYQPIITDLGLAKLGEGAGITQTGVSMGTPAYMSPEQALGEKTDARSDVYSLGVLLFELGLGQRPFPATTISDAIRYHTREAPPDPKTIRPDVPPGVAQIILRTLEKDPTNRYASAQELASALGRLPVETIVNTPPPSAAAGPSTLVTQHQQSLVEMRGSSLIDEFPAVSPGPARIQVLTPQGSVQTVAMAQAVITAGRSDENQIVLNDEKATRQHVRIERTGDVFRVTDLNSTNGTYLGHAKLLPGVPEVWRPDLPIRIGSHHLRLAPGVLQRDTGTIPGTLGAPGEGSSAAVNIFLQQDALAVEPGSTVQLPVILLNQGALVDHFSVSLTGLPTTWVQAPQVLQLMPGTQKDVTLQIQPPRTPQSKAGSYPLGVQVASQDDPTQMVTRNLTLQVLPFTDTRSDLQPQEGQAGQPMRLAIQNHGNTAQRFTLNWQDRADELAFDPPSATVQAEPGEAIAVEFRPKLRKRRWFGSAKQHPIAVKVMPEQGQKGNDLAGTVVSRALLPLWVPPLILLLLLALGGFILNRVNSIRTQSAVATATAQAIAAAQAQSQDSDNDGLTDVEETRLGTDPTLADTDEDGLTDKEEIDFKSKPTVADSDGDNLIDGEERKWGTDPNVLDSDKDGWEDGKEVHETKTHPALDDTDKDGVPDPRDPDPGQPPTPTPLPTSTPNLAATQSAMAQLTAEAGCTVNTNNLNLRSGPGIVYEPPVASLPNGTTVTVLGFNNAGIPDGQWVLVRVRPTGPEGWLNLDYLNCNVNVPSFPVVAPPATPTLLPTVTQEPTLTYTPTSEPTPTDTPTLTDSPTDTPTPTDTPAGPQVIHDLIQEASGAHWTTGAGELSFSGDRGDSRGFVVWTNNEVMEDGSVPAQALETHPEWVDGGSIQGTYTDIFYAGYIVQAQDTFQATVGFLQGGEAGVATFRVMIRAASGNTWIGEITDSYDGQLQTLNIPLAPWAGQTADFILEVQAGATSAQDWATWVEAKIVR